MHYIIYSDHHLWSRVLFLLVATQIPINIAFVAYLFFQPANQHENVLLISFIMSLQVINAILSLYPMAQLSNRIHHFTRYLPIIQLYLRNIVWKIKNQTHFESLTNTNRIAFHVGPFGQLTTKSMFEVN